MAYSITISRVAIKALEKLSEPHYSTIKIAIGRLAENPRPHGYIKLKGRDAYRIRVGDYRIIYEIADQQLLVQIINLGHRREIYD